MKVFKVFPSFDTIRTNTAAQVEVVVKCEGERRIITFNKPVRTIELNKLEALKIAFALLGRIGICEICGTPFRRKGSTGRWVNQRFCSRKCFGEWLHRKGGTGTRALSKLAQAQWHPEKLDNVNIINLGEKSEAEC